MTVVGVLLVVLLLAVGASSMAPLNVTCAPALTEAACQETVTASLHRGLAPFHPLILSAHVEPGEAGVGQIGHRATVTYDLLGVLGPTTVRLFYDIGGHWGGVPSRSAPELATWSLLAAAVVVGIATLAIGLILRRRKRSEPAIAPGM